MKDEMVEEKRPVGSKRLRNLKPDKNKSKKPKKQLDDQESDDSIQLSDDEILEEGIDFNMPKPGPHAKVCIIFAIFVFLNFFNSFMQPGRRMEKVETNE
jgi:hypothetical protein